MELIEYYSLQRFNIINHSQKNETTGDKVVLMNVDLSASGNYTCLVMGETSPFSEDQMTKVMTVVGKTRIYVFMDVLLDNVCIVDGRSSV